MPGVKRINAVFIYVKNMEMMKRFYGETLGLGLPVVETDMWVEYELDGSNLALHLGDSNVLSQSKPVRNTVRFSMEVGDIESFAKNLQEKGVEFSFLPRKDFGSFLAEFKDPEGNFLRIIQFV